MTYDWMATLVFLGVLIVLTKVGRFLVFQIPALQQMREQNFEADRHKLSRKRFKNAVKENNKAGLAANVVFYVAVLPFCIDLEPRPDFILEAP